MRCEQCGSANLAGSRFCAQCAHALPPVQPQTAPAPAVAQALKSESSPPIDERRLVTILFADLAGFTSLAESMDPEEVQELLNRCFDALVPCVERYGGTIDKFMGDAMMVLFGAPVAHDNDAERGIRTALDIREALGEFNQKRGLQLAVHQGISTGRVLAGSVGGGERHDYSVIGDAVNVASRLEDLSEPNEILIGPDTHGLAGFLFETEETGTITVRGRTEGFNAYRVLGQARSLKPSASSRLRSPLVGREKELALFADALDRLARGQGTVLCILGEAGLGKTRLLAEARKAGDQNHEGFTWLEGQAISAGPNVSYRPIKQMLEADVGWLPGDDRGERLAKLERRIGELIPGDHDHGLDFVAALLSVETAEHTAWLTSFDEAAFHERLHRTIAQYFCHRALRQPLVLVVEDLHWVDAYSAALVPKLASLVASAPVLVCLVSRADLDSSFFQPQQVASVSTARYHEVRLGPLTVSESRKLVGELLGSTQLPPGLQQMVEKRAEGNPFFIQEILRSLIDSGGIQEDGRGGWRLTSRGGLAVPDSLQGVIASRVDRLPDVGRTAIRLASVIGRSFPLSLLSSVAGLAPEMTAQRLHYLEDLEMIRTVAREPEPEFSFAHALMQEAVYETIPLRERRLLHERVAQAIESAHSALEDNSDLLAYHYSKAERWDRAQQYLFAAGEKARLLGSQLAGTYYGQALEALLRSQSATGGDREDSHFLTWFMAGVSPLLYQARLSEIEDPLRELHSRTLTVFGPNDRRTLAVAEMLGGVYFEHVMWEEGLALLEPVLAAREAMEGPDDPSLAHLLMLLGGLLWFGGRRVEGERALLRGIELQTASTSPDLEILGMLYTSLGGCYVTQNEHARARGCLLEALTTPGLERTHSYCGLLINLCDVETKLGLAEQAEYHGRLGSEWGSPYLAAFCRNNLAIALRTFGRYLEAGDHAQMAIDAFDTLERPLEMAGALAELAECQLQLGELDEAERTAWRVLSLAEDAPRIGWQGALLGEAFWTMAGVELARNNLVEAERLLGEATPLITLEHPSGDPLWEAELLFRRAQLRLVQGRREGAIADVTEATKLLAGLGGEEHPRRKLMLAEWERLAAEAT